jgi:hypothetical protein
MIDLKDDMKNIYNDWCKLNMKDINAMREEFANSKFVKDDQGKEKFTMIPQLAIKEVAKVFTHGADKYGDFNYSKQGDVLRYIDALHRHTNQYLSGENMDESGVHHLACVAANALMALDGILNKTITDNRNKAYESTSIHRR